MNKPTMIDDIAERLRLVAETASSPSIAVQARRLIIRLNAPVSVALLGFPGAGKLALLNALAERRVLPEAARGVTSELRFGAGTAAQITLSDGTVVTQAEPLDLELLEAAVFLEIERPLPVLRRISFLNVVASPDPGEQKAAISWAARRSDIALWCTATYGRADRLTWASVPDGIRDHGFLVLTGCDGEQAAEIKRRHEGDFLEVYSVDLAGAADGRSASLGELADRISYHVELGRRADADGARLFLRSQERGRNRTHPNSRPVTRPRTRPVTKPRLVEAPLQEHPIETLDTPSEQAPTRDYPKALFGAGFGYLRDRGHSLLQAVNSADAPDDQEVLAHCTETLEHLSELVSSHDEAASAEELSEFVMEAESLVILLENEKSDEAAVEAVSILLQVRREFEVGLAA